MLSRPSADEYFEYYGRYISLVPDGDVRDHLRTQLFETVALLSGVTDAKAEKAYGAGEVDAEGSRAAHVRRRAGVRLPDAARRARRRDAAAGFRPEQLGPAFVRERSRR